MIMISYLYFLKVIICSGILLGYYFLVLRNKAYHQYNRFYLLVVVALSWCIPLLPLSLTIEKQKVIAPVYKAINFVSTSATTPFEVEQQLAAYSKPALSFDNLLLSFYFLISLLMLALFMKALLRIYKLSKKYKSQKLHSYKLFLTKEENAPFSFLKLIFWNTNIDMQTQLGKQILQHELTHIEDRHTYDKIFIQINLLIGWFNPVFWVIKKELELIHEFIADKKSVPNADTEIFAQMLLNTAFAGKNIPLTNPFFFSPIKRRLLMLTKKSNSKFSYIQRIIALPVLTILVISLSLKTKEVLAEKGFTKTHFQNTIPNNQVSIQNNIENNLIVNVPLRRKYKVVIDAGHGGDDAGAKAADGTTESEIVLTLAKILKEQNTAKEIEIVLTRADDKFMTIEDRADFSNDHNADLFLSLHCNQPLKTNDSASGYEIYTVRTETDNGYKKESDALAGYINFNLRKAGLTTRYANSQQAGFFVLKSTKCPGILIETGYMTNKNDLLLLKDEKKLEAMAVSILNGIQEYLSNSEQLKK